MFPGLSSSLRTLTILQAASPLKSYTNAERITYRSRRPSLHIRKTHPGIFTGPLPAGLASPTRGIARAAEKAADAGTNC